MPIFYFDIHEEGGEPTIDQNGEELPSVQAARREALTALGDVAKDYARRGGVGRLSICVRDREGAVLEVAATLELKELKT